MGDPALSGRVKKRAGYGEHHAGKSARKRLRGGVISPFGAAGPGCVWYCCMAMALWYFYPPPRAPWWSASFMVLTGACQFGHGVGGFTTNFIHSGCVWYSFLVANEGRPTSPRTRRRPIPRSFVNSTPPRMMCPVFSVNSTLLRELHAGRRVQRVFCEFRNFYVNSTWETALKKIVFCFRVTYFDLFRFRELAGCVIHGHFYITPGIMRQTRRREMGGAALFCIFVAQFAF